jgi:hypothetical protein
MHSAKIHHFTIFSINPFLNLSKPRGVNTTKADRTMTALSEKSIICKKPRLTALHAGIVLTPPLGMTSGDDAVPGRRERGRGNGNTSSVPIRDAGFAGGKTF